jgi:hypothetical protein
MVGVKMNKYPVRTVCKNSGLPFGICECFECEEDKELWDNTKNGGYLLERADEDEVL